MSLLKADIRNLVYKLCEGREVPLLVTDMIAELFVHRDLFNINTLSRTLNAQANAIIYRDVVVNLDGSEKSVKRASLLFRTLLTSKTAARAVNTLSLAGDPLREWRTRVLDEAKHESMETPLRGRIPPVMHANFSNFTREEIEFYGHVAALYSTSKSPRTNAVHVWAVWLYVFRLMPNIQDFNVSSDYFRFPGFRETLQNVARNGSIDKLRSCSLCSDLLEGENRHACAVQEWDSALISLFAVPGIQSIAAVVSLKSDDLRQLRPGVSSITRLYLQHYQIQSFDLSSLLAATPSLRYLRYHAISDHAWVGSKSYLKAIPEQHVGLEPLWNALHHVSDSLQELHTSHEFDEDSFHFCPDYAIGNCPIYRQRGELSSLKQLHTLTVPYVTLLGAACNDDVWDWDEALPSSLRRITLNDGLEDHGHVYYGSDDKDWTDEDLVPIILSLVKWLSVIKREDQTAEFGLHVAELDEEFNEPVR